MQRVAECGSSAVEEIDDERGGIGLPGLLEEAVGETLDETEKISQRTILARLPQYAKQKTHEKDISRAIPGRRKMIPSVLFFSNEESMLLCCA